LSSVIERSYACLPEFIKPYVQKMYYNTINLTSGLSKDKSEGLLPPKRMMKLAGDGDFKKIGKHLLQVFIEIGGLKPNERILDVGCGIGRVAIPLTDYMKDNVFYEGFDIVPHEIKWCQRNISPRFPNFHFRLVDIYNGVYNRRGTYKAANYKFPYKDKSFDFVVSTSVFTHMLTEDVENYLSEIARVLRNDGRCMITYFLLNPETIELMEQKQSILDFKFERDGCSYTHHKNILEHAIAYSENFVRKLYKQNSLTIREPINYGGWRYGKRSEPFQDYIIAQR
jgi:SAM-dependent methyltransferase